MAMSSLLPDQKLKVMSAIERCRTVAVALWRTRRTLRERGACGHTLIAGTF